MTRAVVESAIQRAISASRPAVPATLRLRAPGAVKPRAAVDQPWPVTETAQRRLVRRGRWAGPAQRRLERAARAVALPARRAQRRLEQAARAVGPEWAAEM